MAINKTKNKLLQITLSKADYDRLESIREQLSALLSIDLNKSQSIAFLIKNYGKSSINRQNETTNSQPRNTIKNGIDYSAQVRALKDKMDVSFTDLSRITGIPKATLKKYSSGIQRPTGENEQLLLKAFKDYGIK